jgi:uncharacterized protein
LDLLPKLLRGGIVVPFAVARELSSARARNLPGWLGVRGLERLIREQIKQASLGAGESESLSLAIELDADLILLDDKAARRLASSIGLPIIGTLGLLLRAKGAGLIPEIRPKLDSLRELPFHIAPRLYQAVLREAGESQSFS